MKIFKLLLVGAFALTIGSCENEADPDSVITSFEKFPVTTTTAPVVASETDEGTYVFNFVMDPAKQVNDVHLEIHSGGNSTATEGVDFEILTHDVELSAFEGQDGFSVEIQVLDDFEVEGEDETVYLTFTTTSPSGVDESQVLVLTIKDSGLEPQAFATAEFELSWAFSNPALANVDACEENIDVDVTFQTVQIRMMMT